MKKRNWKAADIFIAAAILLAAAGFLLFADSGSSLIRIVTEEGDYLYPLNQDRLVTVSGPQGNTVIAIHEGKARIVSSDCPNKICMNSEIDSYPGTLVCLPNRVIVTIENSQGAVDAASY